MRLLLILVAMLPFSAVHAGYDVHVTRRTHWADESGPAIERREWEALAASDSEIRKDQRGGGNNFHFQSAQCSEHVFWWSGELGELASTDPEPCALAKLCAIAKALGASVQGDDGKSYCDAQVLGDAAP